MKLSDIKWDLIKEKDKKAEIYVEEDSHWGHMADQRKRETFARGFEMGVLALADKIGEEKNVWKIKQ